MAWLHLTDQFPELRAALAEAERVVGEAFARAADRHTRVLGPPVIRVLRQEFRPDPLTWWTSWSLDLPRSAAPYEDLSCDLDLNRALPDPELSGWISLRRHTGGEMEADDLWQSASHRVASPAAAVAAVRIVAAELVAELDRLDLGLHLAGLGGKP